MHTAKSELKMKRKNWQNFPGKKVLNKQAKLYVWKAVKFFHAGLLTIHAYAVKNNRNYIFSINIYRWVQSNQSLHYICNFAFGILIAFSYFLVFVSFQL